MRFHVAIISAARSELLEKGGFPPAYRRSSSLRDRNGDRSEQGGKRCPPQSRRNQATRRSIAPSSGRDSPEAKNAMETHPYNYQQRHSGDAADPADVGFARPDGRRIGLYGLISLGFVDDAAQRFSSRRRRKLSGNSPTVCPICSTETQRQELTTTLERCQKSESGAGMPSYCSRRAAEQSRRSFLLLWPSSSAG